MGRALNAKAWRDRHGTAGAIGGLFLASSALTGLLWANAGRLYLSEGFKKIKTPVEAPPLASARLSPRQALAAAGLEDATGLNLRAEAGRLVYEAQAKKTAVLVDAQTGEKLSPLAEDFAGKIAAQYVPASWTRAALERRDEFEGPDGRKKGSVWITSYAENGGTQVVVDARSGQLVDVYDRARRFHFWVMRLHKLDFFRTDKALTAIPGFFLLFLVASGFKLWLQTRKGKNGR